MRRNDDAMMTSRDEPQPQPQPSPHATAQQPPSQGFFEAISHDFPSDFMLRDRADLESYGRDWTRVHPSHASAIALPRTVDEVSALLKLCSAHDVAVVPSGGRTGLAGGAVASHGEVVLSLERMRAMRPVDTLSRTVRVQAGAVTSAVHAHCKPHGLTWPVDFASVGSSQIGGNIATNAGGIRVVRYGPTRHWVLGLQVVTMAGDIIELNGDLEKNNTGFDLRQLLIGSEGTLAVITEATLKLAPIPMSTQVAFFGVRNLRAALRLFEVARRDPRLSILAFEYLTDDCLDVVVSATHAQPPLTNRCPAYVLLEVEEQDDQAGLLRMEEWISDVFENELVEDGVLAQSSKDAAELWQLREGISEGLTHRGLLHKNDVAVPVSRIAPFVDDVTEIFRDSYPDYGVYVFGHLGDGNLHLNILKPPHVDAADFFAHCHRVDRDVFALLQKHRGSVSAEHGIGLLKKSALPYSRTPAELALFRSIKRAFDPRGLLNPGKVFDLSSAAPQ